MLGAMSNNTDANQIAALEQRLDDLERQQKLTAIAIAILSYAIPFRKQVREMVQAIIGGIMNRRH
jgi:hypothetical protein